MNGSLPNPQSPRTNAGSCPVFRLSRDRKSTRLNSTLFACATLFRSFEKIRLDALFQLDDERLVAKPAVPTNQCGKLPRVQAIQRSEEHTSELHSLRLRDALPIF